MKKRFLRILSSLLVVVMIVGSAPLSGFVGLDLPNWADLFTLKADATTEGTYGDLTYEIVNGEVTIADCSSSASGALEIPETIEGYPVTSIGSSAFRFCDSITSVTIPDGVISIGNYAFEYCTSLTSVTIGDSVTSIGVDAFSNCYRLTRVYITDIAAWCGISFEDSYANPLYYAKNLYLNNELVTNLIIPNGVTSIGDYAFYYCTRLTSVTIPDSVTSIGNYAFYYCGSLTDVYYTGTEDEWNKISIGLDNDDLLNATIHFSWVPACSHTSYTEHIVFATCGADGESYKLCNVCGEKFDVTVIPALGHSYGEWATVSAPDCLNEGVESRKCTRCNHEETRTVVALGHTAGEWVVEKEATYFASGEKIRKCVKCGAVLESAEIPQLELNMSIPTPSTATVKYGDSIILHTEIEGTLSDGAKIEWTADNDCFSILVSEDGTTCEISPKSSGKTTFTVTVYDADGNEIASSSQEMTSKAGFFNKFIAFFKKLFGLLKVIPYTI